MEAWKEALDIVKELFPSVSGAFLLRGCLVFALVFVATAIFVFSNRRLMQGKPLQAALANGCVLFLVSLIAVFCAPDATFTFPIMLAGFLATYIVIKYDERYQAKQKKKVEEETETMFEIVATYDTGAEAARLINSRIILRRVGQIPLRKPPS